VAQGQVDDIDLQPLAVVDRELNRLDDIAGEAGAVGIENLQADDAGLGSDPAVDANRDPMQPPVAAGLLGTSLLTLARAADQP